ncbi:MAG: hypothetical protein U0575_14350 [Phycisphaerales bacterium]
MNRLLQRARPLAGIVVLAAIYAAAAIRYHDRGFLSWIVAVNLASDAAVLGIAAVGLTFVVIAGGIDLSVGAVMGLASIVLASLLATGHWPLPLALLAVLALGAAFGAAQGALIHATGLRPFIVTLGGLFIARGLAFVVHLEPLAIHDASHAALGSTAIVGSVRIPVSALAFGATTAVGALVLRRTLLGRMVCAVGGDPDAARLMGVPVGRVTVAAYAVSGACAALAGIVLTLYLSSGSHLEGVGLELDAVAAVVIGGTLLRGGTGTIWGTAIGALVLTLVNTIVTTYEGSFSSGTTKVATAALLLAFVVGSGRAAPGSRT